MTRGCYQTHESFAHNGQIARIAALDDNIVAHVDVCNAVYLNELSALYRGGALGTAIASLKLPLAGI